MNDLFEDKVNQRTQELNRARGKIKQRTEELHHAVYFHALSGLPSRAALLESLQVVCAGTGAAAKTSDQTNFVVLVINLIRFSLINNSLGHTLGDKALVAIAERFQSVLREGDELYQIGGDEFCVLAHHLDTEADIAAYAETILGSLSRAIKIEGLEIFVHARMGFVVGDPTYDNTVDVLRDADTAMQRVKSDGAEGYHIFRADLRAAAIRRLELENALNYALHR
jgi:diguanylate cyclase (GGDEF)-like protein